MATLLHHPRDLPARYYRYIGEIAARWSMVELHLQEIVWTVLGLGPKEGRLLTYGQSALAKTQLFRALGKHWIPNYIVVRELDSIATEVERLNKLRNHFVHGIFGYERGKRRELRLLYIRKLEQKILPRAERKTAADIKKVADDIAALQKKLEEIQKRFSRARKP